MQPYSVGSWYLDRGLVGYLEGQGPSVTIQARGCHSTVETLPQWLEVEMGRNEAEGDKVHFSEDRKAKLESARGQENKGNSP